MKEKIKELSQLSKEELQELLSTPEGVFRLIGLQDKSLAELKESVRDVWSQIKDKEEAAARWLGILIVLSLIQLYPFRDSIVMKDFLILILPSFVIAFYSVASTLLKHPNYLRKNFFVPEEKDKKTRYYRNEAEFKALEKIYQTLHKNYEVKHNFYGYIGPSVVINFSLSILFIIICYIFEVIIPVYVILPLSVASIGIVYFWKKMGTKKFSITYKQDAFGNGEFSETNN